MKKIIILSVLLVFNIVATFAQMTPCLYQIDNQPLVDHNLKGLHNTYVFSNPNGDSFINDWFLYENENGKPEIIFKTTENEYFQIVRTKLGKKTESLHVRHCDSPTGRQLDAKTGKYKIRITKTGIPMASVTYKVKPGKYQKVTIVLDDNQ